MKVKLFKLMFVSVILLSCTNILYAIGYISPDENYSFIRGLNPIVYFIFLICFIRRCNFARDKGNLYFLIFLLFLSSFNLITGRNVDMKMMITGFVCPIIVYQFLQAYKTEYYILLAKKYLVYFYIAECSIAILERILSTTFFADITDANESFRSFALIGHPLQNALCVSIMMSFILFSDLKRKFLLFGLGLLSILCFNTRSSMLLWGMLSIVYWLFLIRRNKTEFFHFSVYILAGGCVLLFLMFVIGWGNRLFEMGVYDESSAAVRIKIFDIFQYYSLQDFILGFPSKELEFVYYNSGTDDLIIENYWLMFILRFGIVFTIPLFIFMIKFLLLMLKDRSVFEKLFIVVSFLLLSSTNNSLSIPNNGILCCFVLSYFAFLKPLSTSKTR